MRVLTELGFEASTPDTSPPVAPTTAGLTPRLCLSLEGLTSVMTKVQAKRWSRPAPGRVVRESRGALRADERGLIVTTAEFSGEAIHDAAAAGKAKIGLLGGPRPAVFRARHRRRPDTEDRPKLSLGELTD